MKYTIMSSIGVMKGRAILHFAVLQEFQQLILSSVPIIHFGKVLTVILITSTLYIIKEKDVQEQVNTVRTLYDPMMELSTTCFLK